ncbi:MAG: hypothetical protein D4S02_03070 [Rhodocyclaceae bacterium]|nr:MAG: hypothetical protein D4S02_03070 [Rhodocyclaceae bacterium]
MISAVNRNSIAAGLIAMMLSLPGSAEPGVPSGGDCTLARDPLRCQALQKARSACKEKRGSGRQKCIQEKLSDPDCSKDKARCEARQLAQEACNGKTGKAKQSCLKDLRLAGGSGTAVK